MSKEIARRVLLLTGALAATLLFFVDGGRKVRVQVQDAVAPYQQAMVQAKSDAEWGWVRQRLEAPGKTLADEFFSPDVPPFAAYLRELAATDFVYGIVTLPASPKPLILSVHPLEPREVTATAPAALAHPYRWLSPWVLAVSLVVYFLIPFPRRLGRNVMQYPRFAGPLADLLIALPLVLFFFAIPWFVVGGNSATGSFLEVFSFRDGWAFLTICMWGLALLAAALFWVSAWYADYAADIRTDAVWVHTVFGERVYRREEIVGVTASQIGLPPWARRLLWLAPLLNWRTLPTTILAQTADLRAVDLQMQDGRQVRLPLAGFPAAEQLFAELREKRPSQPAASFDRLPFLDELQRPWVAGGWLEIVRRVVFLAGVGAAAWMALYTTPELLQIRPTDFLAERARLSDFFYERNFQSMGDYLHYLAEKNPARVHRVAGTAWETLFAEIGDGGERTVVDVWTRVAVDPTRSYRRAEAPAVLREEFAGIAGRDGTHYVVLQTDSGSRYLAVSLLNGPEIAYRPSWGSTRPPTAILHPYRNWCWPLLGVGLTLYVLIPWGHRVPSLIASPRWAAIVEDLLAGVFLAASVAWLVVVAVPYLQELPQTEPIDTVLFLGIAVLGVLTAFAFAADAARRTGIGVAVARDGLWSRSWSRISRYDSSDLVYLREVKLGPPLALTVLVLLLGCILWLLLPLGVLLWSVGRAGVEIGCRDGRRLRLRGVPAGSRERHLLDQLFEVRRCTPSVIQAEKVPVEASVG